MEATVLEKKNWFVLESDEVLEKLGVNLQSGLSEEEARKRKAKYGATLSPNENAKRLSNFFSNSSTNH